MAIAVLPQISGLPDVLRWNGEQILDRYLKPAPQCA